MGRKHLCEIEPKEKKMWKNFTICFFFFETKENKNKIFIEIKEKQTKTQEISIVYYNSIMVL